MTNVFSYFGIQDLHDLARRVLSGDPNDLYNRSRLCDQALQATEATGRELAQLAGELGREWHGEASERGQAELKAAADKRFMQSDQFEQSARSFRAVGDALSVAQRTARELVTVADGLNRALEEALQFADDAINALSPAAGVLNWAVKEVSGVDLEKEANDILLSVTEPIRDQALGLNSAMESAIRDYEKVLREQGGALRSMPGIVRKDAGPVDGPGDADLRRNALFRSVYGGDPVTANDKLLAQALDMQGDDSGNTDPNARVVVVHIKPVPGAGVVYGSAFISEKEVLDPRLGSLYDHGDGRGFDPNADPSQSRASFYVDYEHGIVVIRQNASHTDSGVAAVGDPSVGVEQDPSGRVRLHMEAANPLAPQIAQDLHVSVRGDLVVDPHGGSGPANVNGEVTRFPSWEVYQRQDTATAPATVLQRHEDEEPLGTGPAVGLPQPTVPIGQQPQTLDGWRQQYHPDQGHEAALRQILQYPSTRGDNFFQYPVGPDPYPSVNGTGQLVVPEGHRVR
ncbi:MAG TPA: hypothetical protein VIY28_06930 [Pseudonocardiaceae bacterium]